VDDARLTFELSTVLSKEVIHFHICPFSGTNILDCTTFVIKMFDFAVKASYYIVVI
jgi:hypothetical protein